MLGKTGLRLVCAALGAALLAGCGSARVITRNQYGGVIALEGDRGKAMEQAHGVMGQHCGPGNYQITQEGEEVIGQDTFHNSDTQYGEDTAYGEGTATSGDGNSSVTAGGQSTRGGQSTSAVTSTRNAVEWRVHYQCGGAPAPGAPVGAPAAPPPPPPPPPGG